MIFQTPCPGRLFCPVRTVGSQLYESAGGARKGIQTGLTDHAVDLLEKIGFADGRRIPTVTPLNFQAVCSSEWGIAAAMLLKTLCSAGG